MSAVTIRLVADDEHELVDRLVREAYEHDYGPREHREDPLRLSVNRAEVFEVWVAVDEDSGEILGSVTVPKPGGPRLMEDVRDDELDFRLLAVSPTARHRGLGSQLTRKVIELATERELAGVFMKSAPNMIGAHRLYEKLGFRRDTERDGLISGGVKLHDLYAFRIDVTALTPSRELPTA